MLFSSPVCLCWISVSVLLHGSEAFASTISNKNQLTNVSDLESPFLQLRASLPSFSQPIRPYTLLSSADDYHHMPKPRHRRRSRLMRLLGSSFDPFWVSIDQPSEGPLLQGDALLASSPRKFNMSASQEVRKAAAKHQQRLEKEAAGLDLSSLPSDVATSVRAWLVRSATCELHHQWVDLGPTFWPRWLRRTDCGGPDGERSCSFPSGMECVRAQTAHIKILAWHCIEARDEGEGGVRADSSTEMETGEGMKRCSWRQVPYPVVTACMCSCK
ncbi:noggin-like [Parambassis ranga]|uniref:Noggin n=1 Tax=Parambassis ranga TaxID=210632 RepID=A0A6P7IRU0_9TELE|nr:noggin-like [Parambassis ranga]